MTTIETLNAQLANLSLGTEIRQHHGSGLFYMVSTRDNAGAILGSAMNLESVRQNVAQKFRDFYFTFVKGGAAFYPSTGCDPVRCG